jgi:hypothetical protein
MKHSAVLASHDRTDKAMALRDARAHRAERVGDPDGRAEAAIEDARKKKKARVWL